MLRKFHVAPPAEPDPEDIKPVDLHFRCIVCGAEVTMTAAQDDPERPGTAARTWSSSRTGPSAEFSPDCGETCVKLHGWGSDIAAPDR